MELKQTGSGRETTGNCVKQDQAPNPWHQRRDQGSSAAIEQGAQSARLDLLKLAFSELATKATS
jgi:hypothetical protein